MVTAVPRPDQRSLHYGKRFIEPSEPRQSAREFAEEFGVRHSPPVSLAKIERVAQ